MKINWNKILTISEFISLLFGTSLLVVAMVLTGSLKYECWTMANSSLITFLMLGRIRDFPNEKSI